MTRKEQLAKARYAFAHTLALVEDVYRIGEERDVVNRYVLVIKWIIVYSLDNK